MGYKESIEAATTFQEIENVFKVLFGESVRQEESKADIAAKKKEGIIVEPDILLKPDVTIAKLTGEELGDGSPKELFASAKEWAFENLKGEHSNQDTGESISFGRKGLDHLFQHGESDVAFSRSIAGMKEIIHNAVMIAKAPHYPPDENIPWVKFFYAPVHIGEELFIARLTVKDTRQGQKFYDHEIESMEIEKAVRDMNLFSEVNQNQRLPADGLLSTVSIRQLLNFVKPEHRPSQLDMLTAKGIKTDTNIDGEIIELRGNGKYARRSKVGTWSIYDGEETEKNLYGKTEVFDEAVEMLLESAKQQNLLTSYATWEAEQAALRSSAENIELFDAAYKGGLLVWRDYLMATDGISA